MLNVRVKYVVDNHHGPQIFMPLHPSRRSNGYVQESRLIAERAFGRLLPADSVVHHFDENPYNNNHDNLVLCENHSYHMLLHSRMKAYLASGNPNYRKCKICKQYDDVSNMKYVLDRRWSNAEYKTYYHPKCSLEQSKKYYARHREQRIARQSEYYKKNRELISLRRREEYANRRANKQKEE